MSGGSWTISIGLCLGGECVLNFRVALSRDGSGNFSCKRGLKQRQEQSSFFVQMFWGMLLQTVAPCSLLMFLTAPWDISDERTIPAAGSKRSPQNSPSPQGLRGGCACSPAEPCRLVLVAEDTCTLARGAVVVKAKSKSLTPVPAFKQVYLLWDLVLQCLRCAISHQTADAARLLYCLRPWPKTNAKGQGKEQST